MKNVIKTILKPATAWPFPSNTRGLTDIVPRQPVTVGHTEPTGRMSAEFEDNAAVDRFADMMKAKLAASRAVGRFGWSSPEVVSDDNLRSRLRRNDYGGDYLDVGIYAMFLMLRKQSPQTLQEGYTRQAIDDVLADAGVDLVVAKDVLDRLGAPNIVGRLTP